MPPLEIDSIIPLCWVGKQDEQRGKKERAGGLWPCRTPGKEDTKEKSIVSCLKLLWVYKDHVKLSWLVHRDELSS